MYRSVVAAAACRKAVEMSPVLAIQPLLRQMVRSVLRTQKMGVEA
jgi:hypothetical protein